MSTLCYMLLGGVCCSVCVLQIVLQRVVMSWQQQVSTLCYRLLGGVCCGVCVCCNVSQCIAVRVNGSKLCYMLLGVCVAVCVCCSVCMLYCVCVAVCVCCSVCVLCKCCSVSHTSNAVQYVAQRHMLQCVLLFVLQCECKSLRCAVR